MIVLIQCGPHSKQKQLYRCGFFFNAFVSNKRRITEQELGTT